MMSSFVKLSRKILCVLMWKWSHSKFEQSGSLIYKWGACLQAKQWVGLHLLCLKFYLSFFQEFPKIFLLCLAYYSKIILKRYTCIRNKSFKIVESNEIKSLVLAANCKQGTIWLHLGLSTLCFWIYPLFFPAFFLFYLLFSLLFFFYSHFILLYSHLFSTIKLLTIINYIMHT